MTVTPLKKTTDATRPAPRLTCTWVPVRGTDGRTHMEMRWTDESKRPTRSTRSAA